MGAWGPGLYSDDMACDMRDVFREVKRVPVGPERLAAYMLEDFPAGGHEGDEDYCTFWLVLADQFHAHGIEDGETFSRARAIIDNGQDLAVCRDRGMEAADIRKREKALQNLTAKWAAPPPKPKGRKLLKDKEPFVMEPGQCIAYRTMGGNGPNLHMSQKELEEHFHPDGWSAFVVIDLIRKWDYFARHLIAALNLTMVERPSPADCLAAPVRGIQGIPLWMLRFLIPDTPLVRTVACPPARFCKLDHEVVANFDFDIEKWKRKFPDAFDSLGAGNDTLTGTIHMLFPTARFRPAEKVISVRGSKLKKFLA